jgi:CDP-glucose 4,6-dehydratase
MVTNRKQFWKNKRVLVTGFEGFLGTHLTKTLIACGAKVVGLDIKTLRKDTIFSAQDYKKIIVYKGSVTNRKLVNEILHKHAINFIFHLAAEAIVGRSQEDPLLAFESNITGSWEVLDACRKNPGVQAMVLASSDKAYGSHKTLPYRENAPLLADYPYDVSKSCADLIARTYAHTYGLPVAITRCGNIYGPGDFNFSRLIPDALRCLVKERALAVRSDGKFVRDYIYVGDVVDGYLRIAELLRRKQLSGQAFNLSNESPLTVIQLLQTLNRLNLRVKPLNYRILNAAKYEIRRQYLSSAKARQVLGWKPAYGLNEGLKITAQWYFNYFLKR